MEKDERIPCKSVNLQANGTPRLTRSIETKPKLDLLKHIDKWKLNLKNLLEDPETMTVEDKCSRLARSLNSKWREKATNYMDLGFKAIDVLIQKLKQAHELQSPTNNDQLGSSHSLSHSHSHRAEDESYEYEGDQSGFRKMHCTIDKCDGEGNRWRRPSYPR